MALYELRTYTLRVGAMAKAVKLYQELGFPALGKEGDDKRLVGYFWAAQGRSIGCPSVEVLVRCRPALALGSGVCKQRFRRGVRLKVPATGNDPEVSCFRQHPGDPIRNVLSGRLLSLDW
jgi:hypothetical protein